MASSSPNVKRDDWLYGGAAQRTKLKKAAAAASGQLEPASDHTYRMLITAPGVRMTDWGGVDKDSNVVVLKRKPEDIPDSRQLKDPFTTFYVQGLALEPPLPLDRMLSLTEENTLHSACLMAKATDACGRGWSFEPKEGHESDDNLIESDLPKKLQEHVNGLAPELTFSEMLYQAAWEMGAIGQGVWEVVREDSAPGDYGEVAALYPIPSHTLRATLDPRKYVQIRAGRVRYFKRFGAKCTIDNETGAVYDWRRPKDKRAAAELNPNSVASEVIIFKEYTPRSLWYGVPKWVSAIPTIAEMTAIREFNVSWFASGGQTDYLIHMSAETLSAAKEMVEQIRAQMKENQGRGHTLLITAGTKETQAAVQKLGELLREGHFRFRRGDLAKEVLIAHNVPPYRVGWAETGSLAGNAAEEMLGAYKYGAVEPIQVVIEDRLMMTLFNPDLGGVKTGEFRLKLTDLEYGGDEDERVIKRVQYGIVTPNQGREELGLDADEEHDELDQYYYQGQPLGQEEGGEGDPGGLFGMPGDLPAETSAENADAEGDIPGETPAEPKPSKLPGATAPTPGVPKRAKRVRVVGYSRRPAKRRRSLDAIERFEQMLKEAIAAPDPTPVERRIKSQGADSE